MEKKMIRYAVAEDLDEVYRLTNLLEDTVLNYDAFSKLYLSALGKDVILIAEEDKVIGFLHMAITPQFARAGHIAEIQELIIDEGYRNGGYGKQLLEEAKDYCKDHDIGIIEVLSSAYRKDAHRFYENNGFENTGYRFFNKEWKKGVHHE